jgi:hypothetical protein
MVFGRERRELGLSSLAKRMVTGLGLQTYML